MSNGSSLSEIELLQLCKTGDHSVYEHIVDRNKNLVCSITYSICGDLGKSEELAQEAFIIAWRKLNELKDLEKFKSWLCTIARNLAKRSFRKKTALTSELDSSLEELDPIPPPSKEIIRLEEENLVWETLEQIPENYREPMILFYREEQSISKVAEVLEISQDAVKQRLSRGRKMIKSHLAALIDSTLTNSGPSKSFTKAIVATIATLGASSAKAAGTGTVAAGTIASGNSLISVSLATMMLKLPLIGWLIKLQLESARDEQEKRWTLQLLGQLIIYVLPIIIVIPTLSFWNLSPGISTFAWLVPFVVAMIITVSLCRRFDTKVRAHRQEWINSPKDQLYLSFSHVYRKCLLSLVPVLIWPTILFWRASDLSSIITVVTMLFFLPLIAAKLFGYFSSRTRLFQIISGSVSNSVLISIGLIWFQMGKHKPVLTELGSNYFNWFMMTINGLIISSTIVSALVWKKLNKKSENTDIK